MHEEDGKTIKELIEQIEMRTATVSETPHPTTGVRYLTTVVRCYHYYPVHDYDPEFCGKGKNSAGNEIARLVTNKSYPHDQEWCYFDTNKPVREPVTPPEPVIKIHLVIDGRIDRELAQNDIPTLIVNQIKEHDDPLAEAGRWLTTITNAITEATREEES